MISVSLSILINAPADDVERLYADPANWPRLFPDTIRGAHVLRHESDTTVVEVDHVEGRVVNVLHFVSAGRIELREFKRRYDATFVNEFVAAGPRCTRYRLTARVALKWPWKVAAPVLDRLVAARMRRYVLEPLRRGAEQARAAGMRAAS